MTPDFKALAKKLDLNFKDEALLMRAFTHRSYINEHKKLGLEHNERLEFLGDAVLELSITRFLYDKYPNTPEGDLTSYRAAIVNTVNLSRIAGILNINDYMLFSKGEAKDVGRARGIILADAVEALIGAIYLDAGFDKADDFIKRIILGETDIDRIVKYKLWLDAKSRFQEKAQDEVGITPSYKLVRENGPEHEKVFTVGVFLNNVQVAIGTGLSKREAEQSAAEKGLEAKGWI